jgi:hypothetical protein
MDAIDGKAKWWNCYYIQAQPGFQRGGGECVRASEGGSRPPTKPFIFSPKMPTEQNKRVGKRRYATSPEHGHFFTMGNGE